MNNFIQHTNRNSKHLSLNLTPRVDGRNMTIRRWIFNHSDTNLCWWNHHQIQEILYLNRSNKNLNERGIESYSQNTHIIRIQTDYISSGYYFLRYSEVPVNHTHTFIHHITHDKILSQYRRIQTIYRFPIYRRYTEDINR